ncbi:MAG: hypothetical protein GDA56_32555 [Hormoscilla sp. GM7CHS1pb]|nr:hypothetical protein [Hormoscilla sp. GM7CHS1pb]
MSNPESDRQQSDKQNAPEGDASEKKIVSSESTVPEKSEDSDDRGTEEASEKLPQGIEELLPDEIPDETKKRISTRIEEMSLSIYSQGRVPSPLLVDLTRETKIIRRGDRGRINNY